MHVNRMKARPLLNPHSPRPTPFAPILVVAAALLSGCATSQPLVLTDAVGPAEAAHGPRPALGTLVVYSAWDGQSTLDPGHLKHTPYEVLSSDGVKLLRVPNQRGPFGGDPIGATRSRALSDRSARLQPRSGRSAGRGPRRGDNHALPGRHDRGQRDGGLIRELGSTAGRRHCRVASQRQMNRLGIASDLL